MAEERGLDVEELVVRYGAAEALRGVDLKAAPGTITCVLGRNGAGKSTLFKAIMGLVKSTSGEVSFEGESLLSHSAAARVSRGVAIVPEASGVMAKMSVGDNLRLGTFARKLGSQEREREIAECIAPFPVLSERMNTPAGTLSGGERQMLALSRALLARPRMILLDEPSFGLAPLVVTQVFDELRSLSGRGFGVLLSEQNASSAMKVASYAYVLDRGKVAFEGPTESLWEQEGVKEVLFA